MDIDDDNIEYEVEADKVKILFMNDDGDSTDERGEIIELDPKKLYLGFPNYQNVHYSFIRRHKCKNSIKKSQMWLSQALESRYILPLSVIHLRHS